MTDNQQQKKWYKKWWVWAIVIFIIIKMPKQTIKAILFIIAIFAVILFSPKKSHELSNIEQEKKEENQNKTVDSNGKKNNDSSDENVFITKETKVACKSEKVNVKAAICSVVIVTAVLAVVFASIFIFPHTYKIMNKGQNKEVTAESSSNETITQQAEVDEEVLDLGTGDNLQSENTAEKEYQEPDEVNSPAYANKYDTPKKIDRTGYIYDINQTMAFDNSKITIHRLKICDGGYSVGYYAVFDYTITNESDSILTWNLREHDNVFGFLTIDTYETERLGGNTLLNDDDFSIQTRKQNGRIEPHCTYYGSLLLLFRHWDEHYNLIPIYSNEYMAFELYFKENEIKHSYTLELNK